MEGFSGSGWQRSDSSRALNTSGVSDRNTRLLCPERNPLSGQALQDSSVENRGGFSGVCDDEVVVDPFIRSADWGVISLRQWLDKPDRSVDKFECLHIFRQIVQIVDTAHSQGIFVHNVRPSCFVMSSFNHVSFIESASCSDSGSDSLEDRLNGQAVETKTPHSLCPHDMHRQRTLGSEDFVPVRTSAPFMSESSSMMSSALYAARASLIGNTGENRAKERRKGEEAETKKQTFPMKQILSMEMSWYTSPEEVAKGPSSCASDIYKLGLLLFEVHNNIY